jgi:hypothetical protein
MATARDALKRDLLSLIEGVNAGEAGPEDGSDVKLMIDELARLSPIPDPNNHLSAVAGSWTTLYAAFGAGRSKGKSHQDDSTLGIQTFKAFPETPIRVKDVIQEIGLEANTYNNVICFETVDGACPGVIVIHGAYEPDAEDARRFRVGFHSAEIRGTNGSGEAALRRAAGLPDDAALKRDFKPAKLYSDVVYLDETNRINIGGMGGVYVLERRSEPAISL